MPDDRLCRLAQAVRDRRATLGLAQGDLAARGGPSIVTIGQIERGQIERPQAATLSRLDKALEWRSGTAARLLAGQPIETESVGPRRQDAAYVAHRHPDDPPQGGLSDEEVLALIRENRRLADELERRITGAGARPVDGAP